MKTFIMSMPKDIEIPKNKTKYIAVSVRSIKPAREISIEDYNGTTFSKTHKLFIVEE